MSANATAEDKEEIPDLEFLAFLGSFKTADGKWVDPMEIEKMLDQTEQPNLIEDDLTEAKGNE